VSEEETKLYCKSNPSISFKKQYSEINMKNDTIKDIGFWDDYNQQIITLCVETDY